MSDFAKYLAFCEHRPGHLWCLQADGSLFTAQSGVRKHKGGQITVDLYARIHDLSEGTEAALFDSVSAATTAVEAAKKRHNGQGFAWHLVAVGV